MWIAQEYQPKLTELETQKELYLEIELAGKFGITMAQSSGNAKGSVTQGRPEQSNRQPGCLTATLNRETNGSVRGV
jgi:hypothetical protein